MFDRFVVGPFGTNCYLYAPGQPAAAAPGAAAGPVVLVDPGAEPERLLAALDRAGVLPTHILLTHGHFDHVMGLPGLLSLLATRGVRPKIAIHREDAAYLGETGFQTQLDAFTCIGAMGKRYVVDYFTSLPAPDIILDGGEELAELGLAVIHTPGHTRGSVCFHSAADNLVFSGDTLFRDSVGRTDLPGGSYEDLAESLSVLMKLPPTTAVYPGHGEPTKIGAEGGW